MSIPAGLKYTPEHEWFKLEAELARVGITDYAQQQLGDIVYVELPKVGGRLKAMQPFGVVESVKAASDLFSPISGVVAEVNERLADEPELANSDPYGDGWLVIIEPSDTSELDKLLDATAYEALLAEEG